MVGNELASLSTDLYTDLYAEDMGYQEIMSKEVSDLYFVCPNRALARYVTVETKLIPTHVLLIIRA